MINLNEWAIEYGIPFVAVEDLRRRLGIRSTDPVAVSGESEAAIQTRVRLEASRKGARLFRNNVGATYDESGRFIRFGLCNDSKQMNAAVKSSDLIGLRPVMIEPRHVGSVFGQFVAREIKAATWRFTGTDREVAQLHFMEIVIALGGDAAFANSEGTL